MPFCGNGTSGSFNSKFKVPAAEKGTSVSRTSRTDLNWIFTVQTERVVEKDNTVASQRPVVARSTRHDPQTAWRGKAR